MRILVTEEVQDRFGQGHVLVPQYTILLGAQDGKVNFGATTLGMTLDSMEFPDGTVVALTKAQAGDALGATGVPGEVNNHWGRVLAGAGMTALLAIGTRLPAGNQQGFAPTIGQEVAGQAGGSMATSGQQIVQRELTVRPTITIKYGTPVTVQLTENVNFQTPGAMVRH
jgi:type IV secretion system protein VirB10